MDEAYDEDPAVTKAKIASRKLHDQSAADPRPDRDPAIVARRLLATGACMVAVIVSAGIVGSFSPIGIGGAMLALVALAVVLVGGTVWALKRPDAPDAKDMEAVPVTDLTDEAIAWIDSRSHAVPEAARAVMQEIAVRLKALDPLVSRLDPAGPEADAVRGLIAVQLPALIDEFQRVPEVLRGTPRNGRTPEQTLVDGLRVIESETTETFERLAQTDLDGLQTRGRYLDMKYGDPS
jgi:hypothetical protein